MKVPTLLVAVGAIIALTGCHHESITPMPDKLPAAGLLLRTEVVPLTDRLQLRRYELLRSSISNDFYPFNVKQARRVDKVISRLYVWSEGNWKMLDFAAMPRAVPYGAPYLSPDGTRIIYERPITSVGEGDFPRAQDAHRRVHQVAIYHVQTGQRFLLDTITRVDGLGRASHWRRDGGAVAFSTYCMRHRPYCRTLMVLGPCGQLVLDNAIFPELVGLEYICYSPDGRRIAALRPSDASVGPAGGGVLVEIDVQAKAVRTVGQIPNEVACRHLDDFERLLRWDERGRCSLATK